jgi:hypothetical protein
MAERLILIDGTYHINFTHEGWCNYKANIWNEEQLKASGFNTTFNSGIPWHVDVPSVPITDSVYATAGGKDKVTNMACERTITMVRWTTAAQILQLVNVKFFDVTIWNKTATLAGTLNTSPFPGSKISAIICEG